MPELPEVETVRKGLEQKLKGFHIKRIQVLKERSIASEGGSEKFIFEILGNSFGHWQRRGKYLINSLEKERKHLSGWIVVHLRMTGQFQFLKNPIDPCSHTRVRFWNEKNHELRFVDVRNFGQMWWVSSDNSPKEIIKGISNLGPEPFSNEFNPIYLKQCLKGKTRTIKSALLDQSIVAGVGNIYADESLFEAGILPFKEAGKLKRIELEKLCISLINVLEISIGKGGTTFSDFRDLEGLNGNYGGQAWVYRRSNKSCKKCDTIIKRGRIAGRSTHWCPKCQN